ncbi:metallophosphoesterase [Tsukamurella sp. 8F]|uniref:metallophosphoesterase n=1 Tax=unclassified Tsukamurella TaxID=2633480 RepID=UPI0023B9456B|nr:MULTISPECIES: metallophosphoesterase [unclassified Tsukamurella]MDF0529503.1 metallophosphoesterase [Tsukamurella sp. 8J]MDF0585809.1 metallophosphoesterase [Tsukamurella sp. 8F]
MSTPDCTVVQLTDTHIVPAGRLLRDVVDTTGNLEAALAGLVDSGQRVDALLVSGDLTDGGDPSAYRRLRERVEPAAAALGAIAVYAMGNHDDRAHFRAELLGPDDTSDDHGSEQGDASSPAPHDAVYQLDGARLIVLDSTSPGRHEGWLETGQLEWLADVLATPDPSGASLLVLHHPPLRSAVTTVDLLRLRGAEALARVVAGTDVRMILCGHAHLTGAGSLGGIPVWIGPALSYRIDPMAPQGRHRGFTGFGYSRIDVFDGTAVATAIEVTPAETVYDVPESQTMATLRELAVVHD